MSTTTHDHLRVPENNLLDGREYEQWPGFVYPDELREGDVITDGIGTYQVSRVGDWNNGGVRRPPENPDYLAAQYVRHIGILHTITGPVMGGLLRGKHELIHVTARRRSTKEA